MPNSGRESTNEKIMGACQAKVNMEVSRALIRARYLLIRL